MCYVGCVTWMCGGGVMWDVSCGVCHVGCVMWDVFCGVCYVGCVVGCVMCCVECSTYCMCAHVINVEKDKTF